MSSFSLFSFVVSFVSIFFFADFGHLSGFQPFQLFVSVHQSKPSEFPYDSFDANHHECCVGGAHIDCVKLLLLPTNSSILLIKNRFKKMKTLGIDDVSIFFSFSIIILYHTYWRIRWQPQKVQAVNTHSAHKKAPVTTCIIGIVKNFKQLGPEWNKQPPQLKIDLLKLKNLKANENLKSMFDSFLNFVVTTALKILSRKHCRMTCQSSLFVFISFSFYRNEHEVFPSEPTSFKQCKQHFQ